MSKKEENYRILRELGMKEYELFFFQKKCGNAFEEYEEMEEFIVLLGSLAGNDIIKVLKKNAYLFLFDLYFLASVIRKEMNRTKNYKKGLRNLQKRKFCSGVIKK